MLRGPRLHSYCLLWFIRRCTWLFDVSSREVSHLLEKWGRSKLWNKMWICQNGSDRWICDFLQACVHVWVCVHSEVTLFLSENTCFAEVSIGIHSDSCSFGGFFGRGRGFNINYALKIWVEKKSWFQLHIKDFFFPFSVYSFANLNSCRVPHSHFQIPQWCFSLSSYICFN